MEGMDYCRALFSVAQAVNSSLDNSAVLEAVVRNATSAMNAKGSTLMLLSADRRRLQQVASYGLSDRYMRKGPLDADLSIPEALQGRAVAVVDVATDSRVQYRTEAVEEGIASMLSVPMRLHSKIIGVIRIYTSEPRGFTAHDIEFAEAIAGLGAIAIENARRYGEAKTNLSSLEAYVYRYAGN